MKLSDLLVKLAHEHGFPLAASVDLDRALTPDGLFQEHLTRFDTWLSQGKEGEMAYLRRGRDRRADPRLVFAETKSVFCVAFPYERKPQGAANRDEGPRYARYLRGEDYHETIATRLELMMKEVALSFPQLRWKVCVDTSAVLERTWAALAGLGWIGKNTTLINPKLGSYIFLAEVLISEPTGEGPRPLPNYCGNCTKCLQACPTGAFTQPGSLDSRRCISYWTLEKRGELALLPEDKKSIGSWIAGCDICQEVCPFNIKPSREEVETIGLGSNDATSLYEWRSLLEETPESYSLRVQASALNRVKQRQFSRNLALSLANALPSLNKTAFKELLPLIEARTREEKDPAAQVEWNLTLAFIQKLNT